MIIPVRCFTCGNVLADKWLAYNRLCNQFKDGDNNPETFVIYDVNAYLKKSQEDMKSAEGKAMDALKIHKLCCRRHMLTTVTCLDDI